ncbi:MAG: hypothetical protein K0U13_02465, partial [Chlamydiae bacterium]|nr:hypothetical protein [Chlamydiota bacterium]
ATTPVTEKFRSPHSPDKRTLTVDGNIKFAPLFKKARGDGMPRLPMCRRLITQLQNPDTLTLDQIYGLSSVAIPAKEREQLEELEKLVKVHLDLGKREQARTWARNQILEVKPQEAKLAELALLRYYIERDHAFAIPEISLVDKRIKELTETWKYLNNERMESYPQGFLATLHIVFARILILPSGKCNIEAGAHAIAALMADGRLQSKIVPRQLQKIDYLIKDLLKKPELDPEIPGNVLPTLASVLEKHSSREIHKNMLPVVRQILCIRPSVAVEPHCSSWAIITAILGEARQRSYPDCVAHAISRTAMADASTEVAIRMCCWFETGQILVADREIPIDLDVMLPFTIMPSRGDEPLDLNHPVVRLAAAAAKAPLHTASGSSLSFGKMQERALFERTFSGQYENLLLHLHHSYVRMEGNNCNYSDPQYKSLNWSRSSYLESVYTFFGDTFKNYPTLLDKFQERLENSLWLFDTRYICERDESTLRLVSPGLRTLEIENTRSILYRKSIEDWVENARVFYILEDGKYRHIDSLAAFDAHLTKMLDASYRELYGDQTETRHKRQLATAYKRIRETALSLFSASVIGYTVIKLNNSEIGAADVILLPPIFCAKGYFCSDLLQIMYRGKKTKAVVNTPKEYVKQLASSMHSLGVRCLALSYNGHCMTVPRTTFSVPEDAEEWITTKVAGRAHAFLHNQIHSDVIFALQAEFSKIDLSRFPAGATYQIAKDYILSKDSSVIARRKITETFYKLPVETLHEATLLSDEEAELILSSSPHLVASPQEYAYMITQTLAALKTGREQSAMEIATDIEDALGVPARATMTDLNYTTETAASDQANSQMVVAIADLGSDDPERLVLYQTSGNTLEKPYYIKEESDLNITIIK